MAKRTVLQIFNLVLSKTGQDSVSALTGLTGLKKITFELFQETLYEVYGEDKWQFAERRKTLTMSSATAFYSPNASIAQFDRNSFVNRRSDQKLKFISAYEFDKTYKDWRERTKGVPESICFSQGRFQLDRKPNANCHGSLIDYRGWMRGPTIGTTSASAAATISRFPEEFEVSLIVNMTAYKVMIRRGSGEAVTFYNEVFGVPKPGGGKEDGAMDRMRRLYRSEGLGDDIEVDYEF